MTVNRRIPTKGFAAAVFSFDNDNDSLPPPSLPPPPPCREKADGEDPADYCRNNPERCCFNSIPVPMLLAISKATIGDNVGLFREDGDEYEILTPEQVGELRTQYERAVTADQATEPIRFLQEQIAFFDEQNLPFQRLRAARALRDHLSGEIRRTQWRLYRRR